MTPCTSRMMACINLAVAPGERLITFCLTASNPILNVILCSCEGGYEGAYCQVAAVSTSQLPLLISLSTLLPIAAILVVIVAIIFICRKLRGSQDVGSTQTQYRSTRRAGYDISLCLDMLPCIELLSLIQRRLSSVIFTVQKPPTRVLDGLCCLLASRECVWVWARLLNGPDSQKFPSRT